MSDPIERQDAIDVVKRLMGDCELSRTVQTGLDILPSAQPEIIRCKDCKYYIPYEWMFDGLSRSSNRNDYFPDEIGCSINDHNYSPDGYCSCAERREDG